MSVFVHWHCYERRMYITAYDAYLMSVKQTYRPTTPNSVQHTYSTAAVAAIVRLHCRYVSYAWLHLWN